MTDKTPVKMTRDDLVKIIQDLGVTSLELYDELQRDPAGYNTRMGKAAALRRLVSVYQRDLRLKLTALKATKKEEPQV